MKYFLKKLALRCRVFCLLEKWSAGFYLNSLAIRVDYKLKAEIGATIRLAIRIKASYNPPKSPNQSSRL